MKVIDLLVKIANVEEIPKKFKIKDNYYDKRIFTYNKEYKWFVDVNDSYYCRSEIALDELNLEIEIIKDKTLEDILTPDELKCFEDVKELVTRLSDEDVKTLVKLLFGDKYDEIIDKLKGEENE